MADLKHLPDNCIGTPLSNTDMVTYGEMGPIDVKDSIEPSLPDGSVDSWMGPMHRVETFPRPRTPLGVWANGAHAG